MSDFSKFDLILENQLYMMSAINALLFKFDETNVGRLGMILNWQTDRTAKVVGLPSYIPVHVTREDFLSGKWSPNKEKQNVG